MGLVESRGTEEVQQGEETKDTVKDPFKTTRCVGLNTHRVRYNPKTRIRTCLRCNLTDEAPLLTKIPIKSTQADRMLGKRRQIAERDGFKGCRYCGYITSTLSSLTIEHLDSQHAGGSGEIDNLGLSCTQCNNIKGPMTEDEFLAWLFHRTIPKRIPVDAQVGLHRLESKRRTAAAAFRELLEWLREEDSPLHRDLQSDHINQAEEQ